jgi:hypothetical protein
MVDFNADLDDKVYRAVIEGPAGEQETLAEWQRTSLVKGESVYLAAEIWFNSAVWAVAFSKHCECDMITFQDHLYVDSKCLMEAYPEHKESLEVIVSRVLRDVALAKEQVQS